MDVYGGRKEARMELTSRLFSSIRWSSAGTLIAFVIRFVQNVVLAHLLLPSDFGLMAMTILAVGAFIPVFDLGIGAALIQQKEVSQVQHSTLFWMNVLGGIFLFGIFLIAAPWIAAFFKEEALSGYIRVASLIFLILPWGIQHSAMLQKELRFDLFNKARIFSMLTGFGTALILAFMGYGAWALVWAYLLETAIITTLHIGYGFRLLAFSFQFDLGAIEGMMRFGLYHGSNNFINYISANVDKLLIGKFLDAQSLGLYSLAWNLILIPLRYVNPIANSIIFPFFAKIQDKAEKIARYYQLALSLLIMVNAPFFIILTVASKEFLLVVYGEKWQGASAVLQLLCVVGFLKSLSNPGGTLMLAKGRADINLFWNLFWSPALFVFIYLFLSIQPSIFSVGLAQLSAGLTIGLIWHYLVIQYGAINYGQILFQLFQLLGLLFFLYFLFYFLCQFFPASLVSKFFIKVIICSFCYLVFVYLCFKKELSKLFKILY